MKDLKHKRLAARRYSGAEQKAWRFTVAIIAILVIGASGLYLKGHASVQFDAHRVVTSFNQLITWAKEHKGRLNQKIERVKQVATNQTEQPVHFDFYSELPNMKMPAPGPKEKVTQ